MQTSNVNFANIDQFLSYGCAVWNALPLAGGASVPRNSSSTMTQPRTLQPSTAAINLTKATDLLRKSAPQTAGIATYTNRLKPIYTQWSREIQQSGKNASKGQEILDQACNTFVRQVAYAFQVAKR